MVLPSICAHDTSTYVSCRSSGFGRPTPFWKTLPGSRGSFGTLHSGGGIPTAGTIVSAAAALRVHVLASECCPNHCPGAADTALHLDCLNRTVPCAGTALHACRRVGQFHMLRSFGKNSVRADLYAAFAVDAAIGMQFQRCFSIRVEERLVPLFSSPGLALLSSSDVEHIRSPREAG